MWEGRAEKSHRVCWELPFRPPVISSSKGSFDSAADSHSRSGCCAQDDKLWSGRGAVLEFHVGAEGADEDGAAVAVVTGVDNVLGAGGDVKAAPDVQRVISFENVFTAVVELAIA
jgi:hypothetical protein